MTTFVRTIFGGVTLTAALYMVVPAEAQEIDCAYPTSQLEMTVCAQRGFEEADAELNAVYREAMAEMRQLDQNLPDYQKGAADTLRDAQRAWIPFRDKACESYGFLARGGTMEPQLVASCLATMTRTRIEDLKELILGN